MEVVSDRLCALPNGRLFSAYTGEVQNENFGRILKLIKRRRQEGSVTGKKSFIGIRSIRSRKVAFPLMNEARRYSTRLVMPCSLRMESLSLQWTVLFEGSAKKARRLPGGRHRESLSDFKA